MTTRPSRALAACALLAVAVLAGCGDEDGGDGADDGDRSDRFAAELGWMPGVDSAEVEEEIVEGEGIEQLDVEVVVEDDATPAQVTAVLDAVDRYDDELGFQQDHATVVRREGRETGSLGYGHEDEETTAELVRRWTLAEEGLDPALAWSVDGYGEIRVELGEDADVDDVTEVASEIGGDAELAALPLWTVVADNDVADASLGTENGMTAQFLASWRAAVATLALGPDPDGTSLGLYPQNSPGSYTSDPPPRGSLRLTVGLEIPGVHSEAELTPERHGDLLWPLLRGQLDVVRDLPPGSTFAADNYFTEADGTGGGLDQFLYVTVGKPPSREEPDRGWNVAAARYLASR